VRERLDCRLCGGPVHSVFKFKDSPVANSFSDKPDHDAQKYPLELMQCGCGHVQQRVVLEGLFNGYKYRTPFAYREHLEPLAKWIADKYPQGRVLEIGCNNGTLLNCMMFEGLDCVGVDPSTDHEKGMPVCFTLERAKALGKFDVVVGLNVFAHIDNLDERGWIALG
jgi:methylation protein EvaC